MATEVRSAEESVIHNGDQYFDELSLALSKAQRSIHLETYIFNRDQLGQQLLTLLVRAAARGVHVQLLLDGVGSSQWTFRDAEKLRKLGVHIHFFHPLPWQKKNRNIWRFWSLRRITLELFKLNHRNHRKLCLIDNELLFIGSFNVMEQDLERMSGPLAWRETGVKLKGPQIESFLTLCKDAWCFSRNYFRRRNSHPHFSYFFGSNGILESKRERNYYYHELLDRIKQVKDHIWITSAYFVPDRRVIRYLKKAAERGVDVRLLFPSKSDFAGVKFAMEGFYHSLLKANIQVYEYLPSMLHAKILCFDNWVSIGSANLDHRSLFQDLEANAVLTQKKNIKAVHEQFLTDLSVTRKIELSEWKGRSLIRRGLELFFLLFKRLL